MRITAVFFAVSLVVAAFSQVAQAMQAEATRVVTWRHGETIQGEDFIAASEAIVDYLATLKHPTEALKGIRFDCTAKSRLIEPSVQHVGTSNQAEYSEVLMVYELKDCVESGVVDITRG